MHRTMLACALCVLTAVAMADIVPAYLEFESDQVPLSMLVVPDGSGYAFGDARRDDGSAWGRPFRLRPFFYVWGGGPEPVFVPGLSAEELFLVTADGGRACLGAGNPGAAADDEGWFTWTNPLPAGGELANGEVRLWAFGMTFDEVLPLTFASPDLNGDEWVNLIDVGLFVGFFGDGGPGPGDLNFDGVMNLSDIAVFTPSLGAICP